MNLLNLEALINDDRVDPRERPNIVQLRNHKFIRNNAPIQHDFDNNFTSESLSVSECNEITPNLNSKS